MRKGTHHKKESINLIKLHRSGSGMKGKHFTPDQIETIRKSQLGKKNHNWKGGITPISRKRINKPEWNIVRKECYKRDNYTCQICGVQYADKNGNGMEAHHIIPYRHSLDDRIDNLITLCKSCHRKEEYKYYRIIGGKYNVE